MPHILRNKDLEIHIDLPLENYDFSRFDWTGKIVSVKYKDIEVAGIERTDRDNLNHYGRGLYNEFGMDNALGFDETAVGDWFHKIGIGLLKKDTDTYDFLKSYEIESANFAITSESNRIIIICKSQIVYGYAYTLTKEIKIIDDGFVINYHLQNTGNKEIRTEEYVHNFTAINDNLMGSTYELKFPFSLDPNLCVEAVNPGQCVEILPDQIQFTDTPNDPFFFSYLNGHNHVKASWELKNTTCNIGLREIGSFSTNKVNLWGWTHVISPELFHQIVVPPGQVAEWSRRYEVFEF